MKMPIKLTPHQSKVLRHMGRISDQVGPGKLNLAFLPHRIAFEVRLSNPVVKTTLSSLRVKGLVRVLKLSKQNRKKWGITSKGYETYLNS